LQTLHSVFFVTTGGQDDAGDAGAFLLHHLQQLEAADFRHIHVQQC
jgi:hypothetical protein